MPSRLEGPGTEPWRHSAQVAGYLAEVQRGREKNNYGKKEVINDMKLQNLNIRGEWRRAEQSSMVPTRTLNLLQLNYKMVQSHLS